MSYYSAADLISERASLENQRSPFLYLAQEVHDILGPANAYLGASAPVMGWNDTRDTTGRRMAQFYANGLASLAFPKHDDFFSVDGPKSRPTDAEKSYFHELSEEMQLMLEESNFYDEIPQSLYEGGVYGTGLMKIGEDQEDGAIYYNHQCFGTYFIQEDHRRRLSGVFRDVEQTVEQLLGFLGPSFNVEKLPRKLAEAYKDPKKRNSTFKFLHVVKRLPRHAVGPDQKPFEDVLVFTETKEVLREEKHSFMPFFLRRHARFGNWTYGYGPGWMAMEDGHQSSEASRLFEAFAARSTFPSVKASGSLEDSIRLGAGQVTWIYGTAQEDVAAWAPVGDYRSVMELMASKHQNLEQALFSDLFRGVLDSNKVYSATQAQIMESNQNQQLYPSALRLEYETGRPMLEAVYAIGQAQGRFPEPPDSLRDFYTGNPTKPRFRLRSRITTSVRQQRVLKLAQTLEMFGPVFAQDPDQIMRLNWDEIMPDLFRDSGLAERWIKDADTFKGQMEQVAAAKQSQLAAQQAQQVAGAVADLGRAGQEGVDVADQLLQS